MHDIFASIILGIVEGITEFLPVSSTAHLRIVQGEFLHQALNDPFWKMYAIVIQFGAILCLPTYFWPHIVKLVKTFPKGENGDRNLLTHPLSLTMIGFVCTSIPALLLKKLISANLENLQVMAAALLIGGAVMWAVDAIFKSPTTLEMDKMHPFQAIWVGLVQTLAAIFPGTSRSMSTIAAGQTAGMSRSAALEFSFFLSIPTMTAACLYDLYKDLKPHHELTDTPPVHMNGHLWIVLLVGLVVSYIVALVVVAWFMQWVRRRGFTPFAVYRIILGILLLVLIRTGHISHANSMDSPKPITYSALK